MTIRITAFIIVGLSCLSGCVVGPDYTSPSKEMSSAWNSSLSEGMKIDPNIPARWWDVFGDENLNQLIETAVTHNQDVKAAFSRLEASRALRDYTTGQYSPTVDAKGSYTRYQSGKDGAVQLPDEPDPVNLHSAGFDFLWEIDLFGKIKRSVESSEALYQASIEDYRDVMVTLVAEVCRNYIDLRTTQMRFTYAMDNIKIQSDTLDLTKSRYESEIAGELDVRQAESILATTQAEISLLRIAEAEAIHRLAVLLGETPLQLQQQLRTAKPLPIPNEKVAVGFPADMLRQRPDIRAAERRLAAQTARIGVATADLYPSLQLTGTFEIQSRQLSGLGNIHNQTYSFGPGLGWNLFDGNRIRNTIKIEEAVTQELLAAWENTVLLAVEDVENAIVSYEQRQLQRQAMTRAVEATRRSMELVETQYKSGLTDFQNVLDTQRSLRTQQDFLAASEGAWLQSLIRIYKSFGGGWQMAAIAPENETK
jgi:outer membrane protein, multidrug efflux system